MGANAITIAVTHADRTQTYTVTVSRAPPTRDDNFITTWSATANDAITFPGEGAYTIDWGDGTIDNATGAVNHTYAAAGDYDITASNTITRFYLNYGADRGKLIDIKQWGSAQWASMRNAFYGAENMRMSATDAPDLSAVGTMRGMFRDAYSFNGAIGTWDVGKVTDMADMFYRAAAFNQDIGDWDVDKVTDMEFMFNRATAFNQDIGGWDVSEVKNMGNMFNRATAFNGAIGDWDVDKVADMAGMFNGAAAFNQDIGGWKVGKVKNMRFMFNGAAAFNQDIGGWDVGDVTDMASMFNGAAAFSQNLGRWYIVGTPNSGYNGATDFIVLKLAAQNDLLGDQGPVYALAEGDGDSGNNKFTLITDATGAELSAKASTAAGIYKVRIGASGVNFGAKNAVMVDITVGAAADAALSGLMLSARALSPAFASDAFMYTASVAHAVTSITVTPTLNDANASVMVNGAPVVSGAASGAISLAVGETEIKVVVTAEDGETTADLHPGRHPCC